MSTYGLIILALIGAGFLLSCSGILFIYQRRKRAYSTPYLLLAFLCSAIHVAVLLSGVVLDQLDLLDFHSANVIAVFLLDLAYFSVFKHFEALSTAKPRVWSNSLFTGMICVNATLLVLFLQDSLPSSKLVYQYLALSYLLGILSFGHGTVTVYRTWQLVKERVMSIMLVATAVLLTGNTIYVMGACLVIFAVIDPHAYTGLSMLGGALLVGGVLVFLVNYFLNGYYLDFTPVPVHVMMFYNRRGLLVYSRKVYYPGISPLDFERPLITGAFTAIAAILHGTLGKKASIGFIDASAYQIYFSQAPNGSGTLAVIATGGNHLLQRSLETFTRSIPLELLEEVNTALHWTRDLEAQFDFILKATFPHLRVRKEGNQSYY